MNDFLLLCPTDKEVFDLLMDSKRRLTEKVLHDLARDRGIFYSKYEERNELVKKIAKLTHDHFDISGLIEKKGSLIRNEKSTVMELSGRFTIDMFKEVLREFQAEAGSVEKTAYHQEGVDRLVMNHFYTDLDYGKNTLSQRQPREANFEITIKSDSAVIHFPATPKAIVLEKFKVMLEQKTLTVINVKEIELIQFNKDERTSFFTSLITNIEGYINPRVVRLNISSTFKSQDDEAIDEINLSDEDLDNEHSRVEQELLNEVRGVSMQGTNLVSSPVYQRLTEEGFFITGITWEALEQSELRPLVRFAVSFDNPNQGQGFKCAVQFSPVVQRGEKKGEHSKQFKTMNDDDRRAAFEKVENAAKKVLDAMSQSKI